MIVLQSQFVKTSTPRRLFNRWLINKLTVIVLAIASQTVYAFNAPVADPKFKQCLEQLSVKKQWQNPEDFKEIVCHNKGISSIKGVEAFTNISKLSLYKNKLSDISLEGFSNLTHINLAKNELRNIRLKKLDNLADLYIFGNQLKSLELEQFPKLQQLKANSNKMTVVSFDRVAALKKIYLFNNELEFLDIKTLPALNYMDVRHNPMPDEYYDFLDEQSGLTALHDGNSEDW